MINRITCTIICMFFLSAFSYAQSNAEEEKGITGDGVIIELETGPIIYADPESPLNNNAEQNKKSSPGSKMQEIEFIIGGEGKDGVAKRGTLQVDK